MNQLDHVVEAILGASPDALPAVLPILVDRATEGAEATANDHELRLILHGAARADALPIYGREYASVILVARSSRFAMFIRTGHERFQHSYVLCFQDRFFQHDNGQEFLLPETFVWHDNLTRLSILRLPNWRRKCQTLLLRG